jgi:hypothetical protein
MAMEFKEPHKFCMTETDCVLRIKTASQNISANFFVKVVSPKNVIFNDHLMII